jgi:hypothetical protein
MIASRFLPVFIIILLFKLFDECRAFLLGHSHSHSHCHLSSSSSSSSSSAASMQSFDFSSAMEWDEFYKKTDNYDSIVQSEGGSPSTKTTAIEWHSSVSLDEIASVVPSNGKCLIIGCGDSNLPDRILKQQDRPPPRSLVLLDTSQTCLDQLRERHQSLERSNDHFDRPTSEVSLSNTEIEYVCGDATQLSNYFGIDNIVDSDESNAVEDEGRNNGDKGSLFDMIIDKGLTDALLCGEGWDGPLEKLLYESAKVLSMETGQYLLISYQLPSSTKEFLMDVGEKVGLKWEFDVDLDTTNSASSSEKSNGKYQHVNVAMARRITK